jgi:hypothetical protein
MESANIVKGAPPTLPADCGEVKAGAIGARPSRGGFLKKITLL